LASNTSVVRVDLQRNSIDDDGIKALAQLLTTNNTLAEIDLSYNNITDFGMLFFVKAAKASTTLRDLNVSCNLISELGLTLCGEWFAAPNVALRSIDFSFNKLVYFVLFIVLFVVVCC
jgi:Ran GTPase-activating protein (RanGAP) involved in mRNA processing and transport